MSSSQPSSRPPPKWRSSLSAPKRQRPASSVTLVFAQPEQGSKLGSAIDHLPAAVGFDDAASFMSQASRKRERTLSQASSFAPQGERDDEGPERQIKRQEAGGASRARSRQRLDTDNLTPSPALLTSMPLPTISQAQDSPLTVSPQSSAPMKDPLTATEEMKKDELLKPPPLTTSASSPSSEPQKTLRGSKSSPARSSWFGFSTTRDDSTSSPTLPSLENAASPVTESPRQTFENSKRNVPSSPQSPHAANATPPRSIPSNGNMAAPMSFPSIQYSPPSRYNSNTTSISSVDEEVPSPRFTSMDGTTATLVPAQAVVESQGAKTAERKPSISSLNPSTSRFTLKLPLLGRPKIPLEQAVAVAQAEDIREPPSSTKNTAPNEEANANSGTHSETISQEAASRPSRAEEEQPQQVSSVSIESTNATELDAHNLHEARTASWWDYIGWTSQQAQDHANSQEDSSGPTSHQEPAEGHAQSHDSPASDDSRAEHQEQPSQGAQATAPPEPVSPTDAQGSSSSGPTNGLLEPGSGEAAPKPSSVFSSETAKSHGSAWYSPWAWYPASPATGSSAQVEANVTVDQQPATESESLQTESERVKEEALARETSDSAKPSSSSESPEGEATPKITLALPESPNPIESSIADNKSGWMSFFMSKSLIVKSVANESHNQEEDGMEVMEIDDAPPQPSAAIEIPTGNGVASSLKSPSAAASPLPASAPKSPINEPVTGPPPKEREPRKSDPPAAPLTDSESIKRDTTKGTARGVSPTPSKGSATTPPNTALPNFVLPTWADTFHSPPRSHVPPRHQNAKSKLTGALSYVTGGLFSKDDRAQSRGKGKGKERETQPPPPEFVTFGRELPKALDVIGEQLNPYMLNGGCRVVVIGVAGWSPGAVTRTLAGGLPSSSSKFVNMTAQALEQFAEENGFKFKKITRMPLEGDGTIRKKVSKVYNHLVDNEEWMEDLHAADVIFVASHSQGAIVSTHLVHRLIEDGHILTSRSVDVLAKSAASIAAGGAAAIPTTQAQRVCLLALCGIHLGPLRYLKTSSLQLYIQYVENAAARELFEFQDTESKLSKNYIFALRNVMEHGAKVVYIASLNDQVVPIYSGLFTAVSHPRILRALYIDNDAYHSSDFLSNLLILLIRILNAGLSDRGLLAHLSEATAGTLSGVGHSTAYEEPATYSLAVKYFFSTNDGTNSDAELVVNPFNAVEEQNDYEIPWLLRDMIADTRIAYFFAREFSQLRDAFDDWQPKTTILRDVKKKLQPITRLSTIQPPPGSSMSKL